MTQCEICGLDRHTYSVFMKNDRRYYPIAEDSFMISVNVCYDCYHKNKEIMK